MGKSTIIGGVEISGGSAKKVCPRCGQEKSLDEFGMRQMYKPDGPIVPQSYCRADRGRRPTV